MSAPDWLVARPIAHRGLHHRASGILENTLAAAEAAVAAGFAIECDVQLSADGEAMVFHDFALDRLTGESGPVRERAAADLVGIAISGTADQRIPRLADLLDLVAGRVPLVIEVKSRFDGDLRLTRRTVEVVADYAGPLAVKSFDPDIVAELARAAPRLPRGIVAEAHYEGGEWEALSVETRRDLAALTHLPRSRPDFLSWHVNDLPHAGPFLWRHFGHGPVMSWTVRTPEQRRLVEAFADQMVFEGFRPD